MRYFMMMLLAAAPVSGAESRQNGPAVPVEDFFNQASFENIEELCKKFYHPDIHFEDPIGVTRGREDLINYYKNLYENVISIRFENQDLFKKESGEVFIWKMYVQHRKINSGNTVVVEGASWLKFDNEGLVTWHRDYFDAGSMLYEHVPVLGSLIRWIKERAHGS